MNLPTILAITTTLFFGATTVLFAMKEEKQRKLLLKKEALQKQRIYQIAILKELQDRIGYELDIEKVIDVITGSMKNIFSYSTTSSLLMKNGELVFRTYVEEPVSHSFIQNVKQSMQASLSALIDKPLPQTMQEQIIGAMLNDANNKPLASFFHIPLVIGDKVEGLINLSSIKPGLYKEDEMTILYQITHQASNALSRLQAVLETEKGKLLAMIGSLEDGVFMVDRQNHLVVINEAAKSILRLKENPSTADILTSLQTTYDIASKMTQSATLKATLEEKEVVVGQRTVQVFVNPVIGTNTNDVLGISVLLHDITLEKNVAKIKEDFMHMIVHELRAPLTAIKGASQLIEKSTHLSHDEQAKLMRIIDEQSQRLLDEVGSILDAAKLEAGKFTIQKAQTNLKALITDRIAFFKPQADFKRIQIASDIDASLPHVSVDTFRIDQVVTNLLSNSIKYTPNGGIITITVKRVTRAGEPQAGTPALLGEWETRRAGERQDPQAKDEIIITVADSGIGIPKEKQQALFTKFAQVTGPQTSKGTGLGLFIAKGIVEAHGGTITLESESNHGTTITFTLPIVEQAAATTQIPQPSYVSPIMSM